MTTALERGEGSVSCPGHSLPPGKTRYPLYKRLGGPQGWSGQERKVSPPTGIRYPDRPAPWPVSIPTTLPGPQHAYRLKIFMYLFACYRENKNNFSDSGFARRRDLPRSRTIRWLSPPSERHKREKFSLFSFIQ